MACQPEIINGLRPIIPADVSKKYRSLIERCWASDPLIRPSFSTIVNVLEDMQGFF